jgi:hypothetical protein
MRRWRVILVGGVLAAPVFVGAGPALAMNDNATCRVVTNEVRQQVHAAIDDPELKREWNPAFNQFRNDYCGSLDS